MTIEQDIAEKLDKVIDLLNGIQNLLILELSYGKAPQKNIAKAAGIRQTKMYDFVPKQRKSKTAIRDEG